MRELKCPKCGTAITVDESDYASILNQVKNEAFEAELNRRMAEYEARYATNLDLQRANIEKEYDILVANKVAEVQKRDDEIARLNERIAAISQNKESELQLGLAEKNAEIAGLQALLKAADESQMLAVMKERELMSEQLRRKDDELAHLRLEVRDVKNDAIQREQTLKQQHDADLREAEIKIEYYKDLKLKMSTKMLGESLEEHCNVLFESSLRPFLPTAEFRKDTQAVEGTKGDFIFRDYADGMEYLSIMFEMKNEADNTQKKHRNEDFFQKLDADRKKKGCEYAVLVSLLEPESELYNAGIVDVSHRYEKMYVIRPQFFVPLITILMQAAKKSIGYRRELEIARSQSVDVTNFEHKLDEFKTGFAYNYRLASEKFQLAIKDIDDTIKRLEKVKESLLGSDKNLRLANDKADKLTIKSLVRNNPTMKQKFAEAKAASDSAVEVLEDE